MNMSQEYFFVKVLSMCFQRLIFFVLFLLSTTYYTDKHCSLMLTTYKNVIIW